jgi:hypothetical protein
MGSIFQGAEACRIALIVGNFAVGSHGQDNGAVGARAHNASEA